MVPPPFLMPTRPLRCARPAQVPETRLDELDDTLEEVTLKLSLWQSSAEFTQLTEAWRGCHFEALDAAAMEEAVAKCVCGARAL